MRLSAVVLASLFLACGPALTGAGEKGRSWSAVADADGSALVYGTPGTDDVVIRLSCARATREITVGFRHEPVGAKDGMRIGMELFSEGGNLVLDATGHRLLLDDIFVLEAKTAWNPALRRLLADGRTLSVMVQDGVAEIPLAGAKDGIAALIEACGP